MPAKAGYSTPLLHVAEIERSIRFYELLGFETIDTDRCTPLGWARLHCEGGAVMFLRAEEPVNASAHPVMLYMYTPDLPGLREHLLASGIQGRRSNTQDTCPAVKSCLRTRMAMSYWLRTGENPNTKRGRSGSARRYRR